IREGAVADAESEDEAVEGVRRFFELLPAEPRLPAPAVQTGGRKGSGGRALAPGAATRAAPPVLRSNSAILPAAALSSRSCSSSSPSAFRRRIVSRWGEPFLRESTARRRPPWLSP